MNKNVWQLNVFEYKIYFSVQIHNIIWLQNIFNSEFTEIFISFSVSFVHGSVKVCAPKVSYSNFLTRKWHRVHTLYYKKVSKYWVFSIHSSVKPRNYGKTIVNFTYLHFFPPFFYEIFNILFLISIKDFKFPILTLFNHIIHISLYYYCLFKNIII